MVRLFAGRCSVDWNEGFFTSVARLALNAGGVMLLTAGRSDVKSPSCIPQPTRNELNNFANLDTETVKLCSDSRVRFRYSHNEHRLAYGAMTRAYLRPASADRREQYLRLRRLDTDRL